MNNQLIKLIEGIIICNKHCLNGTVFVEVSLSHYDTFYKKILKTKKIWCVDYAARTFIEKGTKVTLVSCRPVSPKKTHRIQEVKNV